MGPVVLLAKQASSLSKLGLRHVLVAGVCVFVACEEGVRS